MKHVWVVQHENPQNENVKFIGVFATKKKANLAIKKLKNKKGFKKYSKNFYIDKYFIDKISNFNEGFITV